MNGFGAEQRAVVCQLLLFLTYASMIGPWCTVSGLRVIQKPSRVNKKSMINWAIRRGSTHGPVARGNIRFWAWMCFLAGVGMDLLGAFALVAIVATLFR